MKLLSRALIIAVVATMALGAATVYAQDADASYNRALELAAEGDYQQAVAVLEELLEAEPGHEQAQELLADIRNQLEEVEEADPEARDIMQQLLAERQARERYQELLTDHLFQGAQQAFQARQYEEAERELERILDIDPRHREAAELLDRVRDVLQRDEVGAPAVLRGERERRRVWETYEMSRMRRTIDEADDLVAGQRFDEARDKLRQARNSAEALAIYRDVQREQARINSLMNRLEEERAAKAERERREKIERARELAERERERMGELREERIERLMEDARELFEQRRYTLAAEKAAEVLEIAPRHPGVEDFIDRCHEREVERRRQWYQRTSAVETERTWREVAALSIPFSGHAPIYPDNWDEIEARRERYEVRGEIFEPEEWRPELERELEQPVSFDFIATPLEDVVAFLRGMRDVNIVLDPAAVEGRNMDITLELEEVRLKDALDWILRMVDLEYTLDRNAIYISTPERVQATRRRVTRYYDVEDITLRLTQFEPDLRALTQADVGRDDAIGDIFQEGRPRDDEDRGEVFTGEELVEFIMRVIAPGTWEDDDIADAPLW